MRGHFVHSPSDIVAVSGADNPMDKTYKPPKHSDELDEEAPKSIYDSDGEEVISETEHGHAVVSIR